MDNNFKCAILTLIGLLCLLGIGITTIVRNSRAKATQEGLSVRHSQFKTCLASWYSNEEYPPGSLMANGEVFDDTKFTCASWDYPFGTLLKVTVLPGLGEIGNRIKSFNDDSKSVVVLVTDRGPAKYLVEKEGRILDLSKASFAKLAPLSEGLIPVRIEQIERR